jgi:hypothetical protein
MKSCLTYCNSNLDSKKRPKAQCENRNRASTTTTCSNVPTLDLLHRDYKLSCEAGFYRLLRKLEIGSSLYGILQRRRVASCGGTFRFITGSRDATPINPSLRFMARSEIFSKALPDQRLPIELIIHCIKPIGCTVPV